MPDRVQPLRPIIIISGICLITIALFAAVSARFNINQAREEVQTTGSALHRVLSQRAAQHDAHLTSLNALILAADPPLIDALEQVSQNIMRFYPRITGIDIVQLTGEDDNVSVRPVLITSSPEHAKISTGLGSEIAQQKAGAVGAYVLPQTPDTYYLGKKSAQTYPAYAIIMAIDPSQMTETGELPAWADVQLTIDGQTVFSQQSDSDGQARELIKPPVYSHFIDSQNQPLRLTLSRPMELSEIVNPLHLIIFGTLSLFVLVSAHFLWRSLRVAKRAEQKALLLEHETRLAHAARVNSMGELASGIAHELTQPLTALLSQSQAALRLEASGEHRELLHKALTANVREASRAGEILQRMRNYMRNKEPQRNNVEINQIIKAVSDLLHSELERRDIELSFELEKPSPVINADAVEMEQVLYNLIRNAADSLGQSERAVKQICVSSKGSNGRITVTVTDNGAGISADVLPRLFEPFFTTREDGMGLGLALCSTLVERNGGEITAANAQQGGAAFSIHMPQAGNARAVAGENT